MAQLPPKIPNMPANWPNFGHQRSPPPPSTATFHAAAQPSWVDEFFDFSSAKRGAHRRSMSDSIAFLEAASLAGDGGCHDFDRLDEDRLMSMFSDDAMLPAPLPPSLSNPSTPTSDNNSSNEEKPPVSSSQNIAAEEAQSDCKAEASMSSAAGTPEATVDTKRVKRILANRQSAQRSRVRKLQYISELERSVTCLQTEVSALSPRVAFLDHQRSVLTIGNSALKQRIAALAQDKIFKDAHQDALRKEIERLRQVCQQQSLRKMESDAATTTSVAASEADGYCAEEELRI